MRSRQAEGLQQRWLVVAGKWQPAGSWDAAIQGEGIQVKGLPVVGNVALGDDFIKTPPGSARRAVWQLVNCEKLPVRYLE